MRGKGATERRRERGEGGEEGVGKGESREVERE